MRDRDQIEQLAARLSKSATWRRVAKPLAALEDVAHGLAGAAGMFGFPAVSAAAAKVERLAERWRTDPPDQFTSRRVGILSRAAHELSLALQSIPPA